MYICIYVYVDVGISAYMVPGMWVLIIEVRAFGKTCGYWVFGVFCIRGIRNTVMIRRVAFENSRFTMQGMKPCKLEKGNNNAVHRIHE